MIFEYLPLSGQLAIAAAIGFGLFYHAANTKSRIVRTVAVTVSVISFLIVGYMTGLYGVILLPK